MKLTEQDIARLILIDFCLELPCGRLITGMSMPTAYRVARWHRRLEDDHIPQVRLRMKTPCGQRWLVPMDCAYPRWTMRRIR